MGRRSLLCASHLPPPPRQHGGVRGAVHQDGHHGQRPLPLPGQRAAPQEPVMGGGGPTGGGEGAALEISAACIAVPSLVQVWGWVHSGGAGGGVRPRAGRCAASDAVQLPRHRAAGAARQHAAVPPAFPRLLPGTRVRRAGSALRARPHPGLLCVPDHPRPGDGGEGRYGDGVFPAGAAAHPKSLQVFVHFAREQSDGDVGQDVGSGQDATAGRDTAPVPGRRPMPFLEDDSYRESAV